MKIIGTVVLVLIAGMSRSTSAQLRIDPTSSWCIKNRGPIENLENCNAPVFEEIRETRRGVGGFDAAIAMYCDRTEILENCSKSYGVSSKLCSVPMIHEFVDSMINGTILGLGFPCAHSELMQDISNITDADVQCIVSKQEAMVNCTLRIILDSISTTPHHLVSEIDPRELDTGFYNNRTCSNILSAQQCAVKLLEDCEEKGFSTTLDSLFKYINNGIPCENLPRLPKTQVSGMSRSTSAQLRIDPTSSWCIKNRGPIENLENCYAPVFEEIRETRRGVGGFDAAIAMYCDRTEILQNCFKSYGASTKLCNVPTIHELVDSMINGTILGLGFPCAYSELMKDISNITDADVQCIVSKQETMVNCTHRIILDSISTTPHHLVSEIDPRELDTGFYNNRTCSNILSAQQCAVKLLEDCEEKGFSTTLDSLFKYINNDIPCENLPRLPKTQGIASPGIGVVNVV